MMIDEFTAMKEEIRNCQNCKNDFTIEPEDFSFYEKMQVPPPTFCPHCRFIRRMIWRNERSLFKRTCSLCKKNIISMYDDRVPFQVLCPSCFFSDKWGADIYGSDYDFKKPFFLQFKELFYRVPKLSLKQRENCTNVTYGNYVGSSKNVYLAYSILVNSENVSYSSNTENSKDILDSYNIVDSNLIYESIDADKNYSCQYTYWSSNCINSNFVFNCNNCQDCFGCVNLQNKRYCILNEQYKKEDYVEKLKSMNTGSHAFVEGFKKIFWNFALKFPRRYAHIINCADSSGDSLRNCKNAKYSFMAHDAENIKYCYRVAKAKDSMDVCHSWAELAYEHALAGSENSKMLKFAINGDENNFNLELSDYCKNSSNLFGCVSLTNKQYCILNKQYEKDEYFEMVEKIKKQMNDLPYIDKRGLVYKYGEFFPTELCPFGYNEAVVNDHFPLTKEEIIGKGYLYRDRTENKYSITLKAENIPDDIKDIDDRILNEIIECKTTGKAFKLTKYEFDFYKRMKIPVPRLHPDERYRERLLLRNPMILHRRKCMKKDCQNEFETTYAPDRPEIVYCEKCYQNEVY